MPSDRSFGAPHRSVDLEALAEGYRYRPPSSASLEHARTAARSAGMAAGDLGLDAGGGPGYHAAAWAESYGAGVVLDASPSMVAAASGHRGVAGVVGRNQAMPFAPGSFALVYFHLSIHYGDWQRALAEAHRVLQKAGECWVWTLGAVHHRASFLARWFPSVAQIDVARFPDPAELELVMRDRFEAVRRGTELETVQRSAGSWIAAVRGGFVSTLQLVPEAELARGLKAFEDAHPDPEETVSYQMRWDWLSARR